MQAAGARRRRRFPGMTTHRDFAEKSKQQFEYFYSCYL
jgi:hypothetical protein